MWKHHTARSVYARKRVPLCKYERKYELLCGTCQHHTARGLNEYRKYELLTCVSVIQREYPPHVPRVRGDCMCKRHTAQGLHARERVPRVRADRMYKNHIAQGLYARKRVPQVRAVVMCQHHTAPG
jgi:hypothetical protein